MAILRCTAKLPWANDGVRGPESSLTMHFNSGPTAITEASALPTLTAFGTLLAVGLDGIWGSLIENEGQVSAYDLSDPKPRTAFYIGTFPITSGDGTMPGEPALNVSFKADRAAGVPAQRFRGALQLGPLSAEALDTASGHVAGAITNQVRTAFETLLTSLDADGWPWVVGSEASGWKTVTDCRISNEWGTVGTRQFPASAVISVDFP